MKVFSELFFSLLLPSVIRGPPLLVGGGRAVKGRWAGYCTTSKMFVFFEHGRKRPLSLSLFWRY